MRLIGVVAALLLCLGGSAVGRPLDVGSPRPGASFYNRPSASLEDLDQDLRRCRGFASDMYSRDDHPIAPPTVRGALQQMIVQLQSWSPYQDECMISMGYRRFDIAGETRAAFAERFSRLSTEAQAHLVGDATPAQGVLAREWENSILMPAERAASPGPPRPNILPAASGPIGNEYRPRTIIQPSPIGPINLGEGEAAIVVSLRRIVERGGDLNRATPTGLTAIMFGLADAEGASSRRVFSAMLRGEDLPGAEADRELPASMFLFVVPSGTYHLQSEWVGWPAQTVQFCLGTIAFTVRPGEVVDLGVFTARPGGDRRPPSLHMAPPDLLLRLDAADLGDDRRRLAASPQLAAALTSADWKNHYIAGCPRSSNVPIYGFEIPGVASYSAFKDEPSPASHQ